MLKHLSKAGRVEMMPKTILSHRIPLAGLLDVPTMPGTASLRGDATNAKETYCDMDIFTSAHRTSLCRWVGISVEAVMKHCFRITQLSEGHNKQNMHDFAMAWVP